jgi:hypothetical protein
VERIIMDATTVRIVHITIACCDESNAIVTTRDRKVQLMVHCDQIGCQL